MKHEKEIEVMFEELVKKLKEALPDYGKYLVVDRKAIKTHGKGKKRDEGKEADGRREIMKRCEYGIGDRGYDDGKLREKLWDEYGMG